MNRREFIKAGAGAFFVASAGTVLGAGAPSNRVRLAIVGCHAKGRGYTVMQNALKVPGVEIAVVCDVDSRAREAAAAKVKELTGRDPLKEKDLRKVLEMKDVDGILCETPDHWHAWAAWAAMKSGKAVYVEKPCSFCARESEILVATQRATKGIFQMGNQRRSSLSLAAALAEIRKGSIGEPTWAKCWYGATRKPIGRGQTVAAPEWLDWDLWQGPAPRTAYRDNVVHYNWHWFYRWGTGENGNNAPHYTDLARLALGVGYPSRTTSGGGRFFHSGDDWEWPDSVNCTWEFPERKFITWECVSCAASRPYENTITGCKVIGLEGSVLLKANDEAVLFDAKGKVVKSWSAGGDATQVSLTNPVEGLDVRHLTRFADCIRANDPNTASPVGEAAKSMSLVHLANIAQRTGETVRTDPATGALAKGSAGAELWAREYEPGWEMEG